uniref:Hemolymph juvenile hormone binding protein n=1 Tax=Glossina morsitans morsitans TaxID=37546 RepID=A0A1B0G190_GLOMM
MQQVPRSTNIMGHCILALFVVVLGGENYSNAFDYFREKPSYVKSCKIYEPEFTKCSTESIQMLITQVAKGIPELEGIVRRLDPFIIDDIDFNQANTEAANLYAHLTNLTATGLSKLQIKESRVSKRDFGWLTTILVPKLRLEGHYQLNGRVLVLTLQGEGHMFIEIDDLAIVMRTKTKLIEKDGFTFYNITDLRAEIEIGNLRTQFDDLFGGNNKEIEKSTNESFNKNWQEFFEALRPLINETVERILQTFAASFMKSCKLSQPDLTKCSTEAIQKMIKEVIKGVPEFRDVIGSLDPLVLKDIAFKQDGAEAVNILIGLSTLIVKDLSKVQVLENRVQRNDFSFLLKLRMPELRLSGHYKLDGRILLLSLKTEEDVNITTLIKTDLFARDGYTFYNVTKVQNDINIGKLQAQFDNLFGGRNKELERSILTTINENWREFFEVLRPSTTNVVDQITFDLLHKICLLIPAKYFLEDIPTPKQLRGNISPNTL